jgi:putative tryptophan/tyrosine transport system substrate-binding protein
MMGAWTRSHALALLAFALALSWATSADAASETRVAALVSEDADPFQEALSGFKQSLAQQGVNATFDVELLHGDPANVPAGLERLRLGRPDLLLTLGSIASQGAVRAMTGVPIVAGLILNADDLGGASNAACVVLEFPVELELRWLQRILPRQKTIGVLFNPAQNQARIDLASKAARELGLDLQARKVESPKELPEALDSLASRADVLWSVADQLVLNAQTARPILLFSLRNRIPFVGLSLTWVKAGALYALDRDYHDIGMQCGELAVRILHGAKPSTLPPVTPRKVVYSVNLKTARLLKMDFRESVVSAAHSVIE